MSYSYDRTAAVLAPPSAIEKAGEAVEAAERARKSIREAVTAAWSAVNECHRELASMKRDKMNLPRRLEAMKAMIAEAREAQIMIVKAEQAFVDSDSDFVLLCKQLQGTLKVNVDVSFDDPRDNDNG